MHRIHRQKISVVHVSHIRFTIKEINCCVSASQCVVCPNVIISLTLRTTFEEFFFLLFNRKHWTIKNLWKFYLCRMRDLCLMLLCASVFRHNINDTAKKFVGFFFLPYPLSSSPPTSPINLSFGSIYG